MSTQINAATTTGIVDNLQTQLKSYTSCLESNIINLQSSSTTIAILQGSLASVAKEIEEAKNDLSIAKDRVASIKDPERVASYYESWFPMYRPLKHNTIPLLIGLSIFMFVIAVLLVFSYAGISFKLFLPVIGGNNASYGTPFMLVSGLALLFFALMLYAFLGRSS